MKKIIYTILIYTIGVSNIHASFPIIQSTDISIESNILVSNEDYIDKKQKIAWLIIGGIIPVLSILIALIVQLATGKKGIIRYAIYGNLIHLLIRILITVLDNVDIEDIFFLA
tara:strand:- start:6254 stop:6592 length:339 start_codon:yes stop_codon:yes gene_type:complete